MLYKHVGYAIIIHNRILRLRITLIPYQNTQISQQLNLSFRITVLLPFNLTKKSKFNTFAKLKSQENKQNYLFLDELGEEFLGLNGGDIAAIVTPNENAAFDI